MVSKAEFERQLEANKKGAGSNQENKLQSKIGRKRANRTKESKNKVPH